MVIFKDTDGSVFNWVVNNLKDEDYIKNDLTFGIIDDKMNVQAGITYSIVDKVCYVSIYAVNPKWCTKKNLSIIFETPFREFGVKIVKCLTSHRNRKVNKLLWGLKLKEEGLLRYARVDGSHNRVFSITEKELKNKRWYNVRVI